MNHVASRLCVVTVDNGQWVEVFECVVVGCNKWTIQDMWRMVWQEQSGRVVMVTNLVEKGKVSLTFLPCTY